MLVLEILVFLDGFIGHIIKSLPLVFSVLRFEFLTFEWRD